MRSFEQSYTGLPSSLEYCTFDMFDHEGCIQLLFLPHPEGLQCTNAVFILTRIYSSAKPRDFNQATD